MAFIAKVLLYNSMAYSISSVAETRDRALSFPREAELKSFINHNAHHSQNEAAINKNIDKTYQ